jgi:predicted nucleotidyltransferase
MSPYEHLSSTEGQALASFVERVVNELGPDITDMRIFGSKARGDAGPESDLDVLVLVRDSAYALKRRILWIAADISLEYSVLLSPRIIPPDAWNEMAGADTLFFRTICAESLPLLTPA